MNNPEKEEKVCKKCGISIETFRKIGKMYCFDDSNIRHDFEPTQEPMEVNFMQVGRTVACGHCDKRFAEGLKEAEEMAEKLFVAYRCDCKCHDTQEPMECNEKIEDEFIAFWDSKAISLNLGRYSSDITQFWLNKIKQAEERGYTKAVNDIDNKQGVQIENIIKIEREKVVKEIEKEFEVIGITTSSWGFGYETAIREVINLINKQNES